MLSFAPIRVKILSTMGISAISLNKGIYGGNGEIIISSDRSQTVKIFNLSGQKVTSVAVQAGERQVIAVAAGSYGVGGVRGVVREWGGEVG